MDLITQKLQNIIKDKYGQQIVRAEVQYNSGGLIDYIPETQEVKVTTPVFTAGRIYQSLVYGSEYQKGIWIGNRALKAIGINIEFINHWCVMIDGHNFSLDTDTGSIGGNIVINEVQDYSYQFDYYGQNIKSLQQIRLFVQYINSLDIKYNLLFDNCQDYSLIIAKYASGQFREDESFAVLNHTLKNELGDKQLKSLFNTGKGYSVDQFIIDKKLTTYQGFLQSRDKAIQLAKYDLQKMEHLQKLIQQDELQKLKQKEQEQMLSIGQTYNPYYKTIGTTSSYDLRSIGNGQYLNKNAQAYNRNINYNDYGQQLAQRNQRFQQSGQGYGNYQNTPNFRLNTSRFQNNPFDSRNMKSSVRESLNDISQFEQLQKKIKSDPYGLSNYTINGITYAQY